MAHTLTPNFKVSGADRFEFVVGGVSLSLSPTPTPTHTLSHTHALSLSLSLSLSHTHKHTHRFELVVGGVEVDEAVHPPAGRSGHLRAISLHKCAGGLVFKAHRRCVSLNSGLASFRALGLGFRVWGVGFRVKYLGVRVKC